jgi:RNA polymerase sigma factor (TIGR02999 family)
LHSREEVEQLLAELSAGKEEAGENLVVLLYDELRALAKRYMRRERPDHTLQTTDLIHEAYILLGGGKEKSWQDRSHFMRVATRAMRRILIDHARRKRLANPENWPKGEPLIMTPVFVEESMVDLLALDEALIQLAEEDPKAAQVVELRFFGGLSVEETAEIMEVSTRTVKRDWRAAKAWLMKEMNKGD